MDRILKAEYKVECTCSDPHHRFGPGDYREAVWFVLFHTYGLHRPKLLVKDPRDPDFTPVDWPTTVYYTVCSFDTPGPGPKVGVFVIGAQDEVDALSYLPHHVRHSPDGHAWGYSGSGPTELAKDILWHHNGQEPDAPAYIDFRDRFVTTQKRGSAFLLTSDEIEWSRGWDGEFGDPRGDAVRQVLADIHERTFMVGRDG